MIRILISFFLFILILAAIGYGAVWLVDNKNTINLHKRGNGLSFKDVTLTLEKHLPGIETKTAASSELAASTESNVESTVKPLNITPADIEVLVLNGGGAVGSATKMVNVLIGKGYTKAKAGNAESYASKGSFLYFQKDTKPYAEAVKKSLEKEYASLVSKEATTNEQRRSKVVIIIGEE